MTFDIASSWRLPLEMLLTALLVVTVAESAEPVRFQRDVLPILAENCLTCHGLDAAARAVDLRLDTRQGATADRAGIVAIVPGQPDASELVRRVESDDPQERMPPPDSGDQLTDSQRSILRNWIAQGAEYEQHWAFTPLSQPIVPTGSFSNPIDAFVSRRLRQHNLTPAPEAAAETLLRRVTLNLTGLPPTLDEWSAFRQELAKPNADPAVCYERVVDRLLQSPHFGEHLAVAWLDAARYADTNGYFGDRPREMWLWRDWVIHAFNANMPYDQFTVEQLAGDLLPNATVSQQVATGFNRNHMANNETGIIAEEFRVEYVVDRVHTTMTTWLGMTAQCAQCHDHKFDPISQREFYALFAYFNNQPESGLITADDPPPLIQVPTPKQTRRLKQFAAASRRADEALAPIKAKVFDAIRRSKFDPPDSLDSTRNGPTLLLHESFDGQLQEGSYLRQGKDDGKLSYVRGVRGQAAAFDGSGHVENALEDFQPDAAWTIAFWCRSDRSLNCPLSLIEPTKNRRGIEVLFTKRGIRVHLVRNWDVEAIEVVSDRELPLRTWHHVVISYDGSRSAQGLQVFLDGDKLKLRVLRDQLKGSIANAQPLRVGQRDSGLGYSGALDELRIFQRSTDAIAVHDWRHAENVRRILSVPQQKRSTADQDALFDFFVSESGQQWFRAASANAAPGDSLGDSPVDSPVDSPGDSLDVRAAVKARRRAQSAARALQALQDAIPTALVMQEREKPRETFVLAQGRYDQPTMLVAPGVPAALAPWPRDFPANRLGFARWLVSQDNSLTPRVAVNRFWSHCFGAGLVRTEADFGIRGELPSHPELLDWLAVSFRENGWDIKHLIRLIVTSQTYKQRSDFHFSPRGIVDPNNRWLVRGPSGRLSAEVLRDQALAVSGLLVRKVGGPSVKPYQPDGLWEEVSYDGRDSYQPDRGEGLWRRSIYTYVKRQSPPPMLLAFDGPTREKCAIRRPETNTPLQALFLLNDDTFVEAARVLAAKTLEAERTTDQRLERIWQAVLTRRPHPEELEMLRGLLQRQRKRFAIAPDLGRRMTKIGVSKRGHQRDPVDLAAWTVVAHTVLNLDEAITQR